MIKSKTDLAYLIFGTVGALIIFWGYFQMPPQKYFIVGSFMLLLTAIHFKLIYFIALECIVLTGHGAILLGVNSYAQIGLPILLCIQLLIFYTMLGKQNNIVLLIGIVGIAMLSLGFTNNNLWILLNGSTSIAIYSYYNAFKGEYPCTIWAILNTCFASMALYQILIQYY